MPKGAKHCFRCMKPTSMTIQVWHRALVGTDGKGNAKQRSVASVARNLCEEHAADVIAECAQGMPGRRYHRGCQECNQPSQARVQIWARFTADRSTYSTLARCYCTDHGDEAFARCAAPLDPTTWRYGSGVRTGDMSTTRARKTA